MRNIKRRVLSATLMLGLIISFNVMPAHAEWKSTTQGWEYLENGIQKTRWLQDGSSWYYLELNGIMRTGWVYDSSTWYYLMDNGILNDSKTTTTMPEEINGIYKVIRYYEPSAKLYYDGLISPSGAAIQLVSDTGYADKKLYRFSELDDHGNTIKEYYYSPYDGEAYEAEEDGTFTRLGIGDSMTSTSIITKDQAIQNVKNYINDNHKNMPLNFEVVQDPDENNTNAYVIHFYNDESTKLSIHASSTNGWYYVDKRHGNVISMYDI